MEEERMEKGTVKKRRHKEVQWGGDERQKACGWGPTPLRKEGEGDLGCSPLPSPSSLGSCPHPAAALAGWGRDGGGAEGNE